MGNIDKATAKLVIAEIQEAAQAIALKHGLVVVSGQKGTYSPERIRTKVEFQANDVPVKTQDDKFAEALVASAAMLRLPSDVLHRKVTLSGVDYTIEGYNSRARKNELVLHRVSDGKHFSANAMNIGYLLRVEDSANPKKTRELMLRILGTYTALSPEALTADGELSKVQVAARRLKLNDQLDDLFRELGREVSEEEAYEYVKKTEPSKV